jgi:hypothetical protein
LFTRLTTSFSLVLFRGIEFGAAEGTYRAFYSDGIFKAASYVRLQKENCADQVKIGAQILRDENHEVRGYVNRPAQRFYVRRDDNSLSGVWNNQLHRIE